MNMFVFSTRYGTKSVHSTPQGAYNAAVEYIGQKNAEASSFVSAGCESSRNFYGNFGVVENFQNKTADDVAHDLELFFKTTGQNTAPLFFVVFDDKLNQTRGEMNAVVTFAKVLE